MTQLSPAAQAVLDAYGGQVGGSAAITSYERRGIAAALCALQLHVAPLDTNLRQTRIRCAIRDIATELENHQ